MKLLFDQNLSPLLVRRLQDVYPGSARVRDLGLSSADDAAKLAADGGARFLILV